MSKKKSLQSNIGYVALDVQLQFHPCSEPDCHIGCPARKARASPLFTKALELFGGRLPGVCPSPSVAGHNATLMDFLLDPKLGGDYHGTDDYHCPSKTELGKCELGCKLYVFSSKTEKDNHERLFHVEEREQVRRQKGRRKNGPQSHKCKCDLEFSTARELHDHQNAALHRPERKRRASVLKTPAKTTESKLEKSDTDEETETDSDSEKGETEASEEVEHEEDAQQAEEENPAEDREDVEEEPFRYTQSGRSIRRPRF